jgi:hypothetical protein
MLMSIAVHVNCAAQPITSCNSAPQPSDALQFPNKHAWDLFVALVQPAMPIEVARGEPDCSKSIGAVGTTAVWETWRLARTEVFKDDGSEPPEWRDLTLPRGYLGAVPDSLQSIHTAGVQAQHTRAMLDEFFAKRESNSDTMKSLFDPFPNNGVFDLRGGIGETHMNRSTYDFIRDHCLYSKNGLQRYAQAFLDGKVPPIQFPTD